MTPSSNDPPAYDDLPEQAAAFNDAKSPPTALVESPPKSDKAPPAPAPEPSPAYMMVPGPSSYHTQPVHNGQTPIVYRYVHPETGEQIASLLPPNHPEMMCLQSGHIPHTSYGILGILAAVFWFPLGVGLCLLDRHVKCTRCGAAIDKGLCD